MSGDKGSGGPLRFAAAAAAVAGRSAAVIESVYGQSQSE